MYALLLIGCPAEPTPPVEEDTYEPAPYIYDEEESPVPTLTAADLEAAIDTSLVQVLTLNAAPVFPAYAEAMTGAQGDCPSYYEADGNVYWYDQCTSDLGASFNGYNFYYLYDNFDAGDGSVYNGEAISGVAEITTADGKTFVSGGSAYNLVITGDGYTSYYSVIAGSFAWDGDDAAGTWLGEGLAPDITISAYSVPDWGALITVDGGVSGTGGELDSIVFDSVTMMTENVNTCSTEPGGVVSLRDSDGNWYDVVFDGPILYDDVIDPAVCDGCGEAWYRGEPMGTVCADFNALVDWEVSPW